MPSKNRTKLLHKSVGGEEKRQLRKDTNKVTRRGCRVRTVESVSPLKQTGQNGLDRNRTKKQPGKTLLALKRGREKSANAGRAQ